METVPTEMKIRIEVSRRSFIKRRVDRTIDFVSPIPSPFNYGSVFGRMAPDGDPEDAVVLGARIRENVTVSMPVWGRIKFVDASLPDHKWVCGPQQPTENEWAFLERFFWVYARAKRLMYRIRGTTGIVEYRGLERFSVEDSLSR